MAVATMSSRVLGLVREQVMAWLYGAGPVTDIFWVAFRIPNMLRDLFAEGAFSAAFVPTFAEKLNIGKEQARRLLWSLAVLLFITTGAISLIIMIAAKPI
jgi:putative peptidoglycan lipid II flippase